MRTAGGTGENSGRHQATESASRRAIVKLTVSTLFALSGIAPIAAQEAAGRTACDQGELNARLPAEGYSDESGTNAYLQLPGPTYGLKAGQPHFAEGATAPLSVPLCRGRYAVVWSTPRSWDFSEATLQIVDRNLQPSTQPIGISPDHWASTPSITRLDGSRFIVLWQRIRDPRGTGQRLAYGRVYDDTGSPLTREFAISRTHEDLNDVQAHVLPSGRIVVTWYRFRDGVYFRIFEQSGTPVTGETLAMPFSLLAGGEPFENTTVVTRSGFTVFVSGGGSMNYAPPFSNARQFNAEGKPLGPIAQDDSVQKEPGYQQAVEVVSASIAQYLELDLRRSLVGHWEGRLCKPEGSSGISNAIGVHKYSRNPRSRELAVKYCRTWESKCGLSKYQKDAHWACSRGTD